MSSLSSNHIKSRPSGGQATKHAAEVATWILGASGSSPANSASSVHKQERTYRFETWFIMVHHFRILSLHTNRPADSHTAPMPCLKLQARCNVMVESARIVSHGADFLHCTLHLGSRGLAFHLGRSHRCPRCLLKFAVLPCMGDLQRETSCNMLQPIHPLSVASRCCLKQSRLVANTAAAVR